MAFKYKLKEIKVGDTKIEKGVKSTVTDIDPQTGAITWGVSYVPAFDSTFKEFDELKKFITKLSRDTKDEVIDSIADDIKTSFNKYRTHIRKNYPEQYKKTIKEEGVDEAYSGFLRNPEDPDSEKFKQTGAVAEFREDLRALFGKFKGELNNRKFIGGVAEIMVNWKSLLRSQMSEENDVEEISTSGAAGPIQTPYAFKLKKKKKVDEGVGATLGPGPAAGEDGVKDNAYIKQFKYKLVPKDKNGNYVQKGSGLEVKNL